MSNTTIKLKRTDFAASIDAIVLERGEPAIDFDRQILWVGDGEVNLQFAAVNSDAASHAITSAGETGDTHTVSISKYGSVLKGTAATKASFQRLGFYDLGDIAALPSTNSSFPSQDVSDTTGILSRWHWIEKTHAGPRRSLFVTNASISGVGTGSNGSGMGNMRHAGGTSAADITGYRVESLSYEYAGDMLMTNPEFDGGGSHVLVVDYTSSISNNVLKFRRLLPTDIEGGAPAHEMTSDSHSCSASMIYYSRGVNDMTSLSFLSSTTAGKVIKRLSSTALGWSTVDWSEITGAFNPDLGSTALNNNTMRFDSTAESWVINPFVNSINTSAALSSRVVGHELINYGAPTADIFTTYKAYNGASTPALISSCQIGIPGSLTRVSPYFLGSNDGGVVFNVKNGHDQFLFYAGNNPAAGDRPNFWIRKTGGVFIQATTTHSNTYAVADAGSLSKSADLMIGDKISTRAVTFTPSYRALPEYSGILIGATTFIQNNTAASSAAAEIAGLRIDDINYFSSSSTDAKFQPVHMIRVGAVNAVGGAYGARFGSITTNAAPSGVGKAAAGLYFEDVLNSRLETSSHSYGIRFNAITTDGNYPYEVNGFYGVLSGGGNAYGISVNTVEGKLNAYGLTFNTEIQSGSNAYGVNISSILNTSTDAASNTVGLNIAKMRNGHNVAGVSITDLTSSASNKMVGLYINLNTTGSSLVATAVPIGVKYAIYATGGRAYFGSSAEVASTLTVSGNTTILSALTANGATTLKSTLDVTGLTTIRGGLSVGHPTNSFLDYTSNFYGNIRLRNYPLADTARQLIIDGRTGTAAMTVHSGDLHLGVDSNISGNTSYSNIYMSKGVVVDSVYEGPTIDQVETENEFLEESDTSTMIDTRRYRVYNIYTANSPSNPSTIYRLRPGYNGQRITIIPMALGTNKPYIELKGIKSLESYDDSTGARRSNIVVNPSALGRNEDDGGFPDSIITHPEIHIWYHQPVELIFIEDFFAFELDWIDSAFTGASTAFSGGQKRGAWVLVH